MTYTAYLTTESGAYLTTEAGERLLLENSVPITPQPPYPDPIIKPREYPALLKGVNLSGWFTLHGQNLMTLADVQLIQRAGFDHVRLNIAPGYTDPKPAEGGPSEAVGFGWVPTDPTGAIPGIAGVKAAVDLCLAAGLDVIIDAHVTNTTDDEQRLDPMYHTGEADPAAYVRPSQDSFCEMWRNIATAFKDYPQSAIAYEIFNEPQFYAWETHWFDFRNRIIAAIRDIDTKHYLISPLPRGGGTGYLWRNENVADAGHGFSVHDYTPFDFTHRLTDWTGINNTWQWVLNLSYPSSVMGAITPVIRPLYKEDYVTLGEFDAYLAGIGYPDAIAGYVADYVAAGWGRGSYDWIADYVAGYGQPRGNARMFINEFGAFKPSRPMKPVYDPAGGHWSHPWRLDPGIDDLDVDEGSRSRYLWDARLAWESRDIGWCVFDYGGNFGITELSGDAYWRDNGEYCPLYGGVWNRSFNALNLFALFGRGPHPVAQLTYLAEIECYHPDDDSDNLIYWSEDLTQASVWEPFGTAPTIEMNAALAPDGTMTAMKLTLAEGTLRQWYIPSREGDSTLSYSVYIKLGTADNNVYGTEDFTGKSSLNAGTWTRCGINGFLVPASNEPVNVIAPFAAQGSSNVGKTVYVWGFQVNRGWIPTTYTKNEGAPTRTLRFSSLPYTSQIDDTPAQIHYESRLLQPGLIRRDLFSPGQPAGAISIGYGLVEILNTGDLDEYTAASFDGRAYMLKIGRVDQPLRDFTTVLRATMESAEFTFSRMTIKLKDRLAELNNPITTKKYLGDGTDLEGDADLKDRFKPLVFGGCNNITPVLTDEAKRIYQASSGSLYSLRVFEGGREVTAEAVYTSAADMTTNSPSASNFRVWLDGGMFRLGFDPTMAITATCVGAVDDFAPGNCLQSMAESGGWTGTINADDVTALNDATLPGSVGQFIDNGGTALEAMNAIAAGLGIWFGPDSLGELRMGLLEEPTGTPVISLTSADIVTLERSATQSIPAKQITLKYRKNWTKQTELDGSVSASEQQWRRQDNLQVIASDTANAISRKLAPVLEFDSRLTGTADTGANQAAYRLLTLYGTPRDILTVRLRARVVDTLLLDLNDVVSITYPRYGMDAGKLFRVLGIQADYRLGQLDLTLWG